MKCFDCKFYKHLGPGAGQCRRYAPRPSIDEEWFWPLVDSNKDFCGEYKAKATRHYEAIGVAGIGPHAIPVLKESDIE